MNAISIVVIFDKMMYSVSICNTLGFIKIYYIIEFAFNAYSIASKPNAS